MAFILDQYTTQTISDDSFFEAAFGTLRVEGAVLKLIRMLNATFGLAIGTAATWIALEVLGMLCNGSGQKMVPLVRNDMFQRLELAAASFLNKPMSKNSQLGDKNVLSRNVIPATEDSTTDVAAFRCLPPIVDQRICFSRKKSSKWAVRHGRNASVTGWQVSCPFSPSGSNESAILDLCQ